MKSLPMVACASTAVVWFTHSGALAQNLILNPGFEQGNAGFVSDYAFSSGGNCCEGQYTVRGNGSTFNGAFVNPPSSSPDSALMMVVNGSTATGIRVWRQTVTVTPGTRYRLLLRGCTAVAGGPAILQWQVDGALIGTPVSLPTVTSQWVDVPAAWTAPAGTGSIELAVRNLNTARFPNDFYVDDLSMSPSCAADLDDDDSLDNGSNPDGGVTIDDLLYFLAAFDAGHLGADLDDDGEPGVGTPDGGVTIEDLLFFLAHFELGC